jgi:outer membrane receptor protein involved in Fe transport
MKSYSTIHRAWVVLMALILISGVSAFGQETTGSITGTVLDSSGAAIPNAKIEATGGSLPRPITVETDAIGTYSFASVPAGTYTVVATATGFSALKQIGINVVLGRASRVDFKLTVGGTAESVTVTGDAVMVDTTSSASAITVDKSFFDQLPKGRGFYDLIELAPGARNEAKTGGYQIDGASGSENTFYLDGMEVTNVQTGVLSGGSRIPVEAVQQVQVKNGVMDAQYGGAMGGVVNAVIRNGTNSFHGQAGFYFNNDGMQARPRPTLEMDPTDATRTKARYFQNTLDSYSTWNPVFNIGGPILKDKLFFFTGFMPTRTITDRKVTFLSDNSTSSFSRKSVQHYTVNKLDFAPFTKIRTSMSWIWNPGYTKGNLPALQGTDSPTRDWAGFGDYSAANILTGQIDYIATNKLLFSFRGGYHFSNYKNGYALSTLTHIYSSANTMFPTLPSDIRRTAAGWVQQGTARTNFDVYQRVNLSADGSYLANWRGQHNLKFGWTTNRLSNNVSRLDYPYGYYRFYWDQSYTCVTSQCAGKQRGTYGYYRWYTYGTLGDASSDNQGIYLQDSWRVNHHLTLNLGIRAEREFLPSFSKQGIAAAPPIEFGWGKKISPRIGAAWDPKGDGKMRIYGSFGEFYDVMKYEMPRGSFGGDIYLTYYYSLDDPAVFNQLKTYGYPADPSKLPGKFFEGVNWRIPSNDPNNNTVDPKLEPMKQRMFDVGVDYSINPTLVASLRYTNRRLVRTIEDVGTLGAAGEVYFIANPGFGLTVDPKTWDPGFPATPKAKRNYDAIEFRLDQRFSKNYQYAASYTYSRQYGNYSGLASSDEEGRTSPNVNRYFDLPWIGYTEKGTFAEGRLGTDRPHTFKLYGAYTLNSRLGSTQLAPSMQL